MAIFNYSVPSFIKNGLSSAEQLNRLYSWLMNTFASAKYTFQNIDSENFSDPEGVRREMFGDIQELAVKNSAGVEELRQSVASIDKRLPVIDFGKAVFNGTINKVSTTYTMNVAFNKAFSQPPIVTVTVLTSAPNKMFASVSAVSRTSMTIKYHCETMPVNNTANIAWIAVGS